MSKDNTSFEQIEEKQLESISLIPISKELVQSICVNDQFDKLSELLAQVDSINKCFAADGIPIFHFACQNATIRIVKLLLQRGELDRSGRDSKRFETALHFACRSGNTSIVRLLIQHGWDKDDSGEMSGKTPLMVATESEQMAVVNCLFREGVDFFRRNHNFQTALHLACENGAHRMVHLLIQRTRGTLLMIHDNLGDTPLHTAVRFGHSKLLLLLCQHSMAPWYLLERNRNDETPEQLAHALGKSKTASMLFVFRLFRWMKHPKSGKLRSRLFIPLISLSWLAYSVLFISWQSYHFFILLIGLLITCTFMFNCHSTNPGFLVQPNGTSILQNWYGQKKSDSFEGCSFCECSPPNKEVFVHHCCSYDACCEGFNHHCIWVGTTIGKGNLRDFFHFLFTSFCTLFYACVSSPFQISIQSISIYLCTIFIVVQIFAQLICIGVGVTQYQWKSLSEEKMIQILSNCTKRDILQRIHKYFTLP